MAFDRDTLEHMLAAAGGVCHRCRAPLELARHGLQDLPGAWALDVTRPHPKSTVLLPACIACLRPPTDAPQRPRERPRSAGVTRPVFIGYARPRDTPSGHG